MMLLIYEISQLKKGINNIEIELKKFEKKYDIYSEEFYKKFEKGEFGDEDDYMIWSGIYEMLLQYKSKLSKIT